MKLLKKLSAIALSVIFIFASIGIVLNLKNKEKTGVVFCDSVKELCAEANVESVFIDKNSSRKEMLNFLGLTEQHAGVSAVTSDELQKEEVVEICSQNGMSVIETETGFEVYGKFQLKQLIVNGEVDEFYGAEKVAVCFGDIYVLQYRTEQETENAYNQFLNSGVSVMVSQMITTSDAKSSSTVYNSWGAKSSNIDEFNEYLKTNGSDEEIVVAVLDTGINTSHLIFQDRLLKDSNGKIVGLSYYASKYFYSGYDFEDDNVEDGSPKGHGTHVSGIIADLTPDNVKILPIKVMDSKGQGTSTQILSGLEAVYEEFSLTYNVASVNLSLGGDCESAYEATQFKEMFDEIFIKLRSRGILPVVAAGNEAESTTYKWPCCCDETAIVVSALKRTISGFVFDSEYSNYGLTVDIAAPGTGINSATIGSVAYRKEETAGMIMSGTSMAAPHVASMVALINLDTNFMAEYPDHKEIEYRLIDMTIDLGSRGFDTLYGYGALNYVPYEPEVDPSIGTDYYVVENKTVYYDGNYHNIDVTVKNIIGYTIKYGLTPENCNIESVEGIPQFKNNTNGKMVVYFRIEANGMEDIVGSGVLNIKPCPIRIKVDNKEVVYGSEISDIEFTCVSVTSYLPNDLGITYTCSANKFSNVGDYIINASCENSNYNLTVEKGMLTIKPRPITILVNDQESYTALSFEIEQDEYTIVEGEVVNNDNLNIEIYVSSDSSSTEKELELTAYAYNENYEITIIGGTLKIKISYYEIMALFICVAGAVLIVVKIVKKKKK